MFNVIARQSLPSPTQPFVYVDLVALIEAAAPQVYGSQERDMLQDWLLRNAGEQQIVQIPLSVVIHPTGLRATRRLRANTQEVSQ
jgi:hypothetical protein